MKINPYTSIFAFFLILVIGSPLLLQAGTQQSDDQYTSKTLEFPHWTERDDQLHTRDRQTLPKRYRREDIHPVARFAPRSWRRSVPES